ncbi:MAG: O-antigen ligase family protein, partial [Acidobacteriota bacterium]
PLAVARLWPGRMLACFLAGAPLAMAGGSAMGQPWLEAATLGTAAGLLAGQIPPAGSGKPASPSGPFPAAWTYLAISSCSFLAALIRLALEWRGQFPAFLAQAFWSLPVMEQSSSEHVLRAGLVLSGGVLWFLLLRRSLRRPGEIRLAWLGWLAGSLPVAAWGFWQWGRAEAWTGAAVTSLMEDRNVLGSYLVLTMFLAASMIRHQRVLVRRIAGAATLLLAGLLFLSGSKIALLAALGGAAVAALPLMRRRPRAAVLIGLLGVGAALGLFLAAPALLSTATVVQPGGAAQQDTSASPDAAEPGASPPGNGEAGFTTLRQIGSPRFLLFYAGQFRLQVWSAALAAAWERPFLGVGPGLLFRQLGNHYWLSGSGWRPGRENAHNQYLQLAAEIGPAGLLAFLWLLGGVLRPALSPATAAAVRLRGLGLLAYLVTGLTGHPLVLVRPGPAGHRLRRP